jgi:hypothetical protein
MSMLRTITFPKMAYPDNPEVVSSYSFQNYGTACLVCLISTVCGRSKKEEAENVLGRCGASGRHITKLKQSIFFRYLWIVFTMLHFLCNV